MPWLNCRICNQRFYTRPNHIAKGWGKYCSIKCRHESQKKGKLLNCQVCGRVFWRAPRHLRMSKSGSYFCSKSCQTVWRNKEFSGPKHKMWKNGESTYRRKALALGG